MDPKDKFVEKLTDTERMSELYRLFHKCWGQAHDSPAYQKPDWVRLSNIVDFLRGPGVPSPKNLSAREMSSQQLQEEWRKASAAFDQRGDHGGSPGEGAWEYMNEIETELKRRGETVQEPERQ